ncbi:SCO1664 family protein [Aquihabitans sp. G128]|uniref:SCO1664 family protein n=1 Tax=Aquihabitans sp. G128 TaxID=2849779 RepID=UPI001C2481B6|nr:SCO1664 family protein [Aquihabitans sp. G128]QXC60986.1 SCO1664 family protein [Aquihabitans sp. G128]
MPAPDSTEPRPARAIEELLAGSDLVLLGRMPWSSNATFLCELWPKGSRPDAGLTEVADDGEPDDDEWDDDEDWEDEDDVRAAAERATEADDPSDDYEPADGDGPADSQAPAAPDNAAQPTPAAPDHDPEAVARAAGHGPLGRAIYKPHRGERPLWDFPDGLYRREAGAYQLARAIGWDVVPPTIVRDGPFGPGSLQWFIEADFDQHYFVLLEDEATHAQLRRMAAFDLVANSTDRKGGHVLVDAQRHLWGIDNGLCLHAEFKLRTVIWDFAGEPLPAELAEDLDRFSCADLVPELHELLDPFERDALRSRARALLSEGRLPTDPTGRRFPWPLV